MAYNLCKHCGLETSNPKYCSKSCAAKQTNKVPKRKRTKRCSKCSKLILSKNSYCKECWDSLGLDWDNLTLSELKGSVRYQKHSRVREHARKKYLEYVDDVCCKNCGYSKHIEVCHIKAIKDWNLDDSLADINHLKNLVGLCRNCHWEYDKGLLKL